MGNKSMKIDETARKGLLKYWDYEKNKANGIELDDMEVFSKRVFWTCPKGHSYRKTIATQLKYGIRCARCEPLRLSDDPEILIYYDFDKNSEKPENISLSSTEKYWWKDEEGNSWFASVNRMKEKQVKVPISGRKLIDYPKLAAEYNKEKNDVPIEKVGFSSKQEYWWKCKNGHEWYGRITTVREAETACRECKQEETRLRNEELKKKKRIQRDEEHKKMEEKGISLKKIPIEKVEFTTIEKSDEEDKTIKYESSLAYLYPEIVAYWNNEKNRDKTPSNVSGEKMTTEYWWKCEKGHEWIGSIRSLLDAKVHVCKICGKQKFEYQI